jgi:hypothetical protein
MVKFFIGKQFWVEPDFRSDPELEPRRGSSASPSHQRSAREIQERHQEPELPHRQGNPFVFEILFFVFKSRFHVDFFRLI